MKILITVCLCLLVQAADPHDVGVVGYAAGLMADCPGMNRTVTISSATAKTLSVLVFWPTSGFHLPLTTEKRCRLSTSGTSCAAKYLDFKRKTKVVISGYLDTSYSPFARAFAGAELAHGHNVILLEIFPVLFRTYPLAARTTKPLGLLLGRFLAALVKKGLTGDSLEILGGSLGAHIGYHAALKFTEITGMVPARLTGLDPAGPCFRTLPPSERFNPSAAKRVDALHTNIDGFGLADPIAHVDFYANGGEYQPSMAGDFILPCFLVCSHVRAAFYWLSANEHPDQFVASRCQSLTHARHGDCYEADTVHNLLGPKTDFNKTGIYYLPTNDIAPYYMGKKGLNKRQYGVNTYLMKASPDRDLEI